MRTGSLRARVVVTALAVLAIGFTGFALAVTLRYRDGLESDLRNHLAAGGAALRQAPSGQLKQIVDSLALQGIAVRIARSPQPSKSQALQGTVPAKPPSLRTEGNLLVLEEQLGTDQAYAKQYLGGPQPHATATLTTSKDGVDRPVHRLIVAEVAGGLIALTVAAMLLLWGLRVALAPLTHVGRVAARIATGDRGQRLNPRRRDTELGQMAASFDTMVVALDASVEQARRSESAMRRFLADAAHELRTPITALHATVETLLREQPPRPARDALEADLARESARLGRLVNDLLDLARLEASEPLRGESIDLRGLAEEVAAETRASAPQVRIDLQRVEETTVVGDPHALAGALRNLLDNAVAATNGAGSIRVEIRHSGDAAVVRVSDDGPGVPPSERERIFEGFVRLDSNRRAGAGLGLAIVRRIIQQHNGEITCEDSANGACFTIKVPAAPAATAVGDPEPIR